MIGTNKGIRNLVLILVKFVLICLFIFPSLEVPLPHQIPMVLREAISFLLLIRTLLCVYNHLIPGKLIVTD